jgi:hypothetical protein
MMGESWMYWSDGVGLYRTICFGLLALLAGMVVWPAAMPRAGRLGTAFFVVALCSFVVLARWPGLFYPRGFNPDEDQLLAAARALVLDPVFFRAAEAGSSGPLNVYPLLASLVVGNWPTLFSARLVGLGVICVALVAVYFAGRAVFSEPVARFGALLPGAFFGLTNFWDFTHYTSEHVPMALLAVGWALSAWAVFRGGVSFQRRVVLGCLAACVFSMVPFAKLQASLAAVVSSVVLVGGTFVQGSTWRGRLVGAAWVCLAGCAFPLAAIAFFAANGAGEYFWTSYIQNALAYQGSGIRGQSGMEMLGMILFAESPMRPVDFLWYSAGWGAVVLLVGVGLFWMRNRSADWRCWVFSLWTVVLLWLAYAAVVAPQRNYPHYLLFLPVPMGIVAMAFVGLLDEKLQSSSRWLRTALVAGGVVFGLGFLIFWRVGSPNNWAGLAARWDSEKPGPISQKILEAAEGAPGRLCVWGYNPTYYTETKMAQATRLATSGAMFNDNALRPFFLKTYLDDLHRNRPVVFVDAVAPDQFVMMTERDEHGHEVVPEVRDFVAVNYDLFDEIDGVRIYKLKELPN